MLFYHRRTEGLPVRSILDRSLSQSFADKGRQLKAKYHNGDGDGNDEEKDEEKKDEESKRSKNEEVSLQPLIVLCATVVLMSALCIHRMMRGTFSMTSLKRCTPAWKNQTNTPHIHYPI